MSLEKEVLNERMRVFRYINSRIQNSSDAEDLTQDALIKALRNVESIKKGSSVVPWIMQIAHNTMIDHVQKKSTIFRKKCLSTDTGAHISQFELDGDQYGESTVTEDPDPETTLVDRVLLENLMEDLELHGQICIGISNYTALQEDPQVLAEKMKVTPDVARSRMRKLRKKMSEFARNRGYFEI